MICKRSLSTSLSLYPYSLAFAIAQSARAFITERGDPIAEGQSVPMIEYPFLEASFVVLNLLCI